SVRINRLLCVSTYSRASGVCAQPATYSGSTGSLGTTGPAAAAVSGGRAQSRPSFTSHKNEAYWFATVCQLHSRSTHVLARAPNSRATSRRETSRFKYSYSTSSSAPPTGAFRHTSSGSSANAPTSDTITARPSPSARSRLPDVSPTVG